MVCAGPGEGRLKKVSLASFDALLSGAVVILIVVGVLFIYSSGINSNGVQTSREFLRQIVWAVTGVGLMVFFAFLSYTTLRMLSLYIYAGGLLLLLITLAIGREVNGARSWLGFAQIGIQPAEFVKLSTIIFLATYLTGIGNGIRELPRFLLGMVIAFAPVALIMLQPDMGEALAFFPIFLLMGFVAGAQIRHLLFVLFAGVIAFVLAAIPTLHARTGGGGASLFSLLSDPDILKYLLLAGAVVTGLAFAGWRSFHQRYFFWISWVGALFVLGGALSVGLRIVLHDYQIMRLVIFVNPKLDPQGAGWNIIQSVTAIGSGGLHGKGFLRGTQSHYQFLPQQSTDFIFSILAEEWGFLGALLVFGLVLVILLRGISIVWASREDYAMLAGTGILAMIFFHALVNVGMAAGIMPVTGIPLMFLSYGGSSLWTGLIGVGIVMNIGRRRLLY
jgi:rod shape determining protein RodA